MQAKLGRVLPLLASEYGTGFEDKMLPYSPAHDWQVLRGVNAKIMQLFERPDRLLKAVPFIVDKATWGPANATYSYPWVTWRPSGAGHAYQLTHLVKFFEFWAPLQGERFVVHSSNANVQAHGFVDRTNGTVRVLVNNIRSTPQQGLSSGVQLAWPPGLAVAGPVCVTRLFWSRDQRAPALTSACNWTAPPTALWLEPGETQMITVAAAQLAPPRAMVTETTYYAPQVLVNTTPASVEWPSVNATAVSYATLRLSLGGPFTPAMLAPKAHFNGQPLTIDAATQLAGRPHVNSKDTSFMGALSIPVPATAVRHANTLVLDFPVPTTLVAAVLVVANSQPMPRAGQDVQCSFFDGLCSSCQAHNDTRPIWAR